MRSAVAPSAALLVVLSPAIIISGHISLAYNNKLSMDLLNSGINQETQQECGNSYTSNIISSGCSGLPRSFHPGLTSPTPTMLTLRLVPEGDRLDPEFKISLLVTLTTITGSPIAGATIETPLIFEGVGDHPILAVYQAITNTDGSADTVVFQGPAPHQLLISAHALFFGDESYLPATSVFALKI